MKQTQEAKSRTQRKSLGRHRAAPFVLGGVVLALTIGVGMLLDGGEMQGGHHGDATLLLVLIVAVGAALFLYDPVIRWLDRLTGR